MHIGTLLEQLIEISRQSKTDFALAMNMTPSGLSKILTGNRLPATKEKKKFIKDAADYFTEHIYSHACYLNFTDIFPVLYNFKSVEELNSFLIFAIEYALDKDLAAANQVNLEFTERGFYYIGRHSVLNLICILLSDYLTEENPEKLDIYSTIPTSLPAYSDIFLKSIIVNPDKCTNVILNHFFNGSIHESSIKGNGVSLNFISATQRGLDLYLWEAHEDLGQPFLLIKGKLLLIFNSQLDGSPLLIPVTHKGFLNKFHGSLMAKNIRKISYNKQEVVTYLERNPETISQVLEQGIDKIINFIPIGYSLQSEDIHAIPHHEQIGEWMLKLLQSVLLNNTEFSISLTTLDKFAKTGKLIVPFIGVCTFPFEDRLAYLQRFDPYLGEADNYDNIKVLDSRLVNMAFFYAGEYCLIYAIDQEYALEKIHIFSADKVRDMLDKMTSVNNFTTLSFSDELWQTYLSQFTVTV